MLRVLSVLSYLCPCTIETFMHMWEILPYTASFGMVLHRVTGLCDDLHHIVFMLLAKSMNGFIVNAQTWPE